MMQRNVDFIILEGEMIMLSYPEHGWCNVEIGDFVGSASYLGDIPMVCLETFIQYLTKGNNINSASIYFDEEGTEFYVVFDYYSTYIIIERNEKPELKYFNNIGAKQLANEFVNDLERDFDKWVDWECYHDIPKSRSDELRLKIEELKQLIKS